jgi:hypothetical protein
MISQTAQGLASLGRNGDSMLVHMSPEEVGGLKQVGDSLGIRMSTNPQTGMPEAFSFGDFFTSFLPTIVGAAVGGPAGGGLMSSMTPILAGAGTGALLAAAKGDDPLMGGLTGGFGGYGGSQLGSTFGKAFGGTGGTTAGAVDDMIAAGAQQTTGGAGNVGMFTAGNTGMGAGVGPSTTFGQAGTYAQAVPNLGVTANTPNPFTGAGGFDSAAKTVTGGGGYTTAPLDLVGDNISNLGTGVKNLSGFGDMSIGDAYKQFTTVGGGSAADLAMPVGTAVLSGLEPSDLGYGTGNLYDDPDKGKYKGPQGQLNLSDRFDTGLRLATGGTIQSGGIRDLYGTPDNQPTISPGLSGFGLGRLNNLAGEQAMTQAQTLGYADGGDVVAGERGMNLDKQRALNLDLVPSLNVETGKQNYTTPESFMYNFYTGNIPSDSLGPLGQLYSYTMKGKLNDGSTVGQNLYDDMMKSRTKMAKGGYLDGAGDGMSDSIPATIEGKQPARLADGEFVIPADVVSHLGNGSSKAGSKRLYAMLDKVRHARTGNKKQGKQIKPAKYMPA